MYFVWGEWFYFVIEPLLTMDKVLKYCKTYEILHKQSKAEKTETGGFNTKI